MSTINMWDLFGNIPYHVAQGALRYVYGKQLFDDYFASQYEIMWLENSKH